MARQASPGSITPAELALETASSGVGPPSSRGTLGATTDAGVILQGLAVYPGLPVSWVAPTWRKGGVQESLTRYTERCDQISQFKRDRVRGPGGLVETDSHRLI